MKMVKSLVLALSLTLTVSTLTSKKAEAGLLLSPATGGAIAIMAVGQGVLYGSTGAGFLGLIGYTDMARLWGAGLLLIGLEDDVNETSENISSVLSTRYPMIADQTVFDDIAELVMNSENVQDYDHGVMDVKVNETELRSVIERLDSTGIEADLESLVFDLI